MKSTPELTSNDTPHTPVIFNFYFLYLDLHDPLDFPVCMWEMWCLCPVQSSPSRVLRGKEASAGGKEQDGNERVKRRGWANSGRRVVQRFITCPGSCRVLACPPSGPCVCVSRRRSGKAWLRRLWGRRAESASGRTHTEGTPDRRCWSAGQLWNLHTDREHQQRNRHAFILIKCNLNKS